MLALLGQRGMPVNLRVKAETATTVTLEWDRISPAIGFAFYVDDVRKSHTMDGTRTTVKFSKPDAGPHAYTVQELTAGDTGEITVPVVTPPPPTPPPSGKLWGFCLSPPGGDWTKLDPASARRQLEEAKALGMNCPRISGHDFAAQLCDELGFPQYVSLIGSGKSFPGTDQVIAYCRKWPKAIIDPGNELNIGGSTWTPTSLARAQLQLNQAMKAAGVKNKLGLSSVGNSRSDQGGLLPLEWCIQLAANGCKYPAAFDIAHYHHYDENPDFYDQWMHVWTPDGSGRSCQSVFGNPPFILGEFGKRLSEIGNDLNRQATLCKRYMDKIKSMPLCLGGMWYTLLNTTDAGTGWGLVDDNWQRRPVWNVFKAGTLA